MDIYMHRDCAYKTSTNNTFQQMTASTYNGPDKSNPLFNTVILLIRIIKAAE